MSEIVLSLDEANIEAVPSPQIPTSESHEASIEAAPSPQIPTSESHEANIEAAPSPQIPTSESHEVTIEAAPSPQIPTSESPGLFKRLVTRFPSLVIWKVTCGPFVGPWKNPLIMFPISFIFTFLNAIFMLQLCFGGFGSGFVVEEVCPKNSEPCLQSNCRLESQYSFWYANPEYYPSADDLPCSPVRQAAVSFSSRFPRATYKFAEDASSSLSTLAVCTDASLQQLNDLLMVPLKSSILFTSDFFSSDAQISLPHVSATSSRLKDFDENTRFRMQDMRYQWRDGMHPWAPPAQSNSSYYASCCIDNFCVQQLMATTRMQPDKFVWGAIPKITSSTSSQKCRDLFECNGGLAMVPISGPTTCSDNVFVIQAKIHGIGWMFRGLFIAAFVMDALFLFAFFCAAVSGIRLYRSRASITTAESMKEHSLLPPEFFQELISKGKLDTYLRCSRDVRVQWFLDQAELNVITSAFSEFYLLLTSNSPTDASVAYVNFYKSTDFGQQHGHYEVLVGNNLPRLVPKHWKEHAKTFRFGPIRMLFSLAIVVLINMVYPALTFSSLASCPSPQRTFNIMVLTNAIRSICMTVVGLIKSGFILDKIEK
jgi:hypothetical protein